MKAEILELLLRYVHPCMGRYAECLLLDIGRGWEAGLLRVVELSIARGLGIDAKAPDIASDKLRAVSIRMDTRLPFDDASFDLATVSAVLEHLGHSGGILAGVRPGTVSRGEVY
ncbi:MAG: class I SAM-dependent methyltransferase [Proteobacteria bacterium]|nr:class I SAM-dependent methyltransferase [Pseudomonadota bacterium]